MKKTASMAIKSVFGRIDPNKLDNSFEVYLKYLDIWFRLYDR